MKNVKTNKDGSKTIFDSNASRGWSLVENFVIKKPNESGFYLEINSKFLTVTDNDTKAILVLTSSDMSMVKSLGRQLIKAAEQVEASQD